MRKKITAILIAFSMLVLSGCAAYISDSRVVFGTEISMSVKLKGRNAQKALDEMWAAVSLINDEVSLSKTDSKLYYLNEKSAIGEKVEISEHTYKILKCSVDMYELTSGAFSIAVPHLSRLWNVDIEGLKQFHGTESRPNKLPSIEQVNEQKAKSDLSKLKLYNEGGKFYVSRESEYLKIDAGGIAKGYAADECAAIAKRFGIESAMIDISGNLMVLGSKFQGSQPQKWSVGITNPRPRGSILPSYIMAIKTFGNVSVVTSGDYVRWYAFGETEFVYIPHIIDPRSGLPLGVYYNETSKNYYNTSNFVNSATVIAPSSMIADALATAVCVLGLEKGKALLEKDGYGGIILTEDKRIGITGDLDIMNDEEFSEYKTYTRV